MADAQDEADLGPQGLAEEVVCEEGAPDWVVTFGDMMSLLLTFFILLLSFSTIDAVKFKELAGSIKHAFGVDEPAQIITVPTAKDLIQRDFQVDENAMKLLRKLRHDVEPRIRSHQKGRVDVEVFRSYRGVVLLFPADDIFERGTDRIRAEARPLLDYVADQAVEVQSQFELVVEVRAPEDAPRSPDFDGVWSLTAAQALAVSKYLREVGGVDASRVKPVGRGPAPATRRPGETGPAEGRSTVEFLFLSPEMKPD